MITDIKYSDDGTLNGKLLGIWDIYGTDLADLKIAAKEAIQAATIILKNEGVAWEQNLLEIIEDLYTKNKNLTKN